MTGRERAVAWGGYVLLGVGVLLAVIYPNVQLWQQVNALNGLVQMPPIQLVGQPSAQMMPSGRWRVKRTVHVSETCVNLQTFRIFRGAINGQPAAALLQPVVESSRPSAIGMTPRNPLLPPDTYEDWFEYDPIPGFIGSQIVSIAASGCPSGYNGEFVLYVQAVDWRNL